MKKVKIEPFHIIGLAIRTTNTNGQAAKDIPVLWDEFVNNNISDKIPAKVDDTIYSVYTDYEGDHTQPYTTVIGCKVARIDSVPEGLTAKSIPGGEYAELSAKGNLHTNLIADKWVEIWASDLNRAYTADFEVYGSKAKNLADAEVDFLIAIK